MWPLAPLPRVRPAGLTSVCIYHAHTHFSCTHAYIMNTCMCHAHVHWSQVHTCHMHLSRVHMYHMHTHLSRVHVSHALVAGTCACYVHLSLVHGCVTRTHIRHGYTHASRAQAVPELLSLHAQKQISLTSIVAKRVAPDPASQRGRECVELERRRRGSAGQGQPAIRLHVRTVTLAVPHQQPRVQRVERKAVRLHPQIPSGRGNASHSAQPRAGTRTGREASGPDLLLAVRPGRRRPGARSAARTRSGRSAGNGRWKVVASAAATNRNRSNRLSSKTPLSRYY